MAHWAKINNDSIVEEVIVAEDDAQDWLVEVFGGQWIKTSYNTKGGIHYNPNTGEPSEDQSKAFRKNYAGYGYRYDAVLDAFIPPAPAVGEYVLNEQTCLWEKIEQ